MALLKEKTLSNGVSGNYWKITSISVDRLSLKLNCKISMFVSQEHCNTSPVPGTTKSFLFVCTKNELMGNLASLGYAKIKEYAATIIIPEKAATNFTPEIPAVYGDEDLKNCQDA